MNEERRRAEDEPMSKATPNSEQQTPKNQGPGNQHLTPALSPERRGCDLAAEAFITKETVAERLGVTPETVRRWASDGRLPSHHFGRRLRFKWSEVESALMKLK